MTCTLRIEPVTPGDEPMSRRAGTIAAVVGPSGVSTDGLDVLASSTPFIVGADGTVEISNVAQVTVAGDPIIYLVTVGRHQRHLDLSAVPDGTTVSWGDPSILVLEGPAPSDWVPVAGPGVPTGGSTGQVLAKASGTDYDTAWVTGGGGGGGGIPETIIDAAGDLIVGTADNTAGRLGVGTSGQVLTSNGTTATWAAPSGGGLMQSVAWETGAVYALPARSTANTFAVMTLGVMTTHPIWLPAGNYSGLSVQSTVAAVSTWRLGIYSGGPYTPGTLLHDCGTINMNATPGSLLASSAFTIATTGIYWVSVLVDAYTATPTVYAAVGTADAAVLPWLGAQQLNAAGQGRLRIAVRTTGVTTGAMPATAPTGANNDTAPLIRAHAA